MADEKEWQYQGDNTWVYGVKVRGIIRKKDADIYFDEGIEKPGYDGGPSSWTEYGWRWLVYKDGWINRGISINLQAAIEICEKEMGVTE